MIISPFNILLKDKQWKLLIMALGGSGDELNDNRDVLL